MNGSSNVELLERLQRGDMTPEEALAAFKARALAGALRRGAAPEPPLCFEPAWQERALSRKAELTSPEILLLAPIQVPLEPLRTALFEHGVSATPVTLPTAAEHWQEAGRRAPHSILFCCPESSSSTQPGALYSMLAAFTQGLLRRGAALPTRLVVGLISQSSVDGCLQRALAGMARTLRQESPALRMSVVEVLSAGGGLADAASALASELLSGDDVEVRLSGERRELPIWRERPRSAEGPAKLREGGVYLISGGLGGLGARFAQHLAERHRARVVLAGRTAAGPALEAKLARIGAAGGEVAYFQADLTRPEEAEQLVDKASARFGSIHGVIHAAGVLADRLLVEQDVARCGPVLLPKVAGCLNLDAATSGLGLDFFVSFSSIASAFGNVGQCEYAYANRFLDAFAALRSEWVNQGRRSGRSLSVLWPVWDEGGMSASASQLHHFEERLGLRPLQTQAGLSTFNALVTSDGSSRVLVLSGDAARLRSLVANPELAAAAAEPRRSGISGPERSPANEATRQAALTLLTELLARRTQAPAERIHAQDSWDKYGVDSVLALDLTRELEATFGTLPKTLFFERRTLGALASYLAEHHAARLVSSAAPLASSEAAPSSIGSALGMPTHGQGAPLEIAVVGMAGRFPMANDLDTFWANLATGRDCIGEIPASRWDHRDHSGAKGVPGASYSRWGGFLDDVECFDPLFFNISRTEAEFLDPQERLFLETAWHAFEDAGYPRAALRGRRIGVFAGVMWGSYQLLETSIEGRRVSPMSSYGSIANRVSHFFDTSGPSLALDCMCSSSLAAVHLACQSLASGESELALAGGVNVMVHPSKYAQLCQQQFLSSDGRCRSFGAGGDGYVPGEGAGAVVLKPLARALADGDAIYGVIRATAFNHGGRTNGYTVPNPDAQAAVVGEALAKSGLDPATIGYIEAHGTGTALGDPLELAALERAFAGAQGTAALGSVKSNIGHLESAAGVAGLIKLLLQLQRRELVPTLHSQRVNPHINFSDSRFRLQQELAPWSPAPGAPLLRGGVSSFGAGGANAHVVVEEAPPAQGLTPAKNASQLIVLSARTPEQLRDVVARLHTHLRATPAEVVPPALETEVLDALAASLGLDPSEIARDELFSALGVGRVELNALRQRLSERLSLELDEAWVREQQTPDGLMRAISQRLTPAGGVARAPRNPWRERFGLVDLAFTLLARREAFGERLACVVASFDELGERLGAFLAGSCAGFEVGSVARADLAHDSGASAAVTGAGESRSVVLGRAATAWVAGLPVNADSLFAGECPRVVRLPPYPFARMRCWITDLGEPVVRTIPARQARSSEDTPVSEVAVRDSAQGAEEVAPGGAFTVHWEREAKLDPPPRAELPALVLIFAPASARPEASALRRCLANGSRVIDITLGVDSQSTAADHFCIDCRDPYAFAELLDRLPTPDCIYFLARDPAPDGVSALAALTHAEEHGVLAFLHLVRALGERRRLCEPLALVTVTHGTCAVVPGDSLAPLSAALTGLALSVAREQPALKVGVFDLPQRHEVDAESADCWQTLVDADLTTLTELRAIRHGLVFRRALIPVELPDVERRDAQLPLVDRGVYLIVGGGSGLGLETAVWLAGRARARIAVVGRRTLDATLEQRLSRIAEAGGQWLYVSADAGDPTQMKAALTLVQQRFGSLNGVVHSALVLCDRPLAELDVSAFRSALDAKARASLVLTELTAGRALDFVLFHSSLQSLLGNRGQANYAAGCTFQDAWAAELARSRPYPVRVINWGFWGEVGAVASERYRRELGRLGIFPLSVKEGLHALGGALAAACSPLIYLRASSHFLQSCGAREQARATVVPVRRPALVRELTRAGERHREATVSRVASALASEGEAFGALDRLAVALILRVWLDAGLAVRSGTRLSRPELAAALGVTTKHRRLLDALTLHFVRRGLLRSDGRQLVIEPALAQAALAPAVADPSAALRALGEQHPNLREHAALLEDVALALPSVLSGRRSGLELLFPNGASQRVESIYRGSETSDAFNRLVGAVASEAVERWRSTRPNEPIRIVEVGGGSGATSAAVLAALADRVPAVDYLFTDVAPALVHRARERFASAYPFLRFGTLDITCDPRAQGFAMESADLVIGANVVHATPSLRTTLAQLKTLLTANGILLLGELVEPQLFYDLTFGLLDGWWAFEDEDRRLPSSPLADERGWRLALAEAGFEPALISGYVRHGEQELSFGQSLLLGASDGVIAPVSAAEARRHTEQATRARARDTTRAETVTVSRFSGAERALELVRETVAAVVRLDASELDLDTTFIELGVDSILALELTRRLAETLRAPFEPKELFDHPTIRKLGAAVAERSNGAHARPPHAVEPMRPASRSQARSGAPLEIAIIGMSGRFAEAPNLDVFWQNLARGRDSVGRVSPTRWLLEGAPLALDKLPPAGLLEDAESFDPFFFNISPLEAEMMDPQQRLFLEEAWKALEDAGLTRAQLDGSRCGVFVGCRNGDYDQRLSDGVGAGAHQLAGNDGSVLAARIAYFLNLKGPSLAIDTACSSALTAIHLACQSLTSGGCELAIAGAVCVLSTAVVPALFAKANMLSTSGRCRAFDASADGFVPAEGVGALILKPLSAALADGNRIWGIIRASGLNQDGATNGIMAPSAASQAALAAGVYREHGIDPETISYVEAHGTGTKLGDPIEIAALTRAFGEFTSKRGFCGIGSVKSNIGHALAAAGIAGVIKVLLAMKRAQLPPTLHFVRANEQIDFAASPFFVNDTLRPWAADGSGLRRAAVSAFGFSGTNGHLVLESPPEAIKPHAGRAARREAHLIAFSAKTAAALSARMREFRGWLERNGARCDLADVSYTLLCGRSHFPLRSAFVVGDVAELKERLERMLDNAPGPDYYRAVVGAEREALAAPPAALSLSEARTREDLARLARLYVQGSL